MSNPCRVRLETAAKNSYRVLLETERQLKRLFRWEERTSFSVELDLVGTAFQKKCLGSIAGIFLGETRSYGQLAKQLGKPRVTRAVGSCQWPTDPIAQLIVPAHRMNRVSTAN